MKIVKLVILALAVYVFQSHFVDWISIYQRKPDFLVIYLILFSLHEGQISGTIAGFFLGLLQDLLSPSFLGLNVLVKSITGFVTGYFKLFQTKPEFLFWFFVFSWFHDTLYYYFYTLNSQISFWQMIFRYTLPNTIYTTLIGFIIFLTFFEKSEETG